MKFHLKRASDGQYHFNLISEEGEILLNSELYKSSISAKNGINSVITNSGNKNNYQLNKINNKYQFTLKANNGQIIGQSQAYTSSKEAYSAIERMLKSFEKQSPIESKNINIDKTDLTTLTGSVKTFLQKLEQINHEDSEMLFFRGHQNFNFRPVPSIYREKAWIENEEKLFRELILRCPNEFASINSTFQTLVKMQHYSLPTRLLDITTNPLIALFFACAPSEENGEVLVFKIKKSEIKYYDSDTVSLLSNLCKLKHEIKSPPNKKTLDNLIAEIRKEKPNFESKIQNEDLNSVICVKPMLDNPRIIKQDGAFLLFGIDTKKPCPAEIPSKYILHNTERVIINNKDKQKILKQLELLGISNGTIFPEIENVASHIKRSYQDK
ncbi:DUF1508 domain-containing protein [Pseudomonas sp. zbq_18]|uniref:DUF1508 domain-containing protein n=1 Tax=Pseudomonas sp. zbq_18 TaxID=3367251 RepID=UPI00370A3357